MNSEETINNNEEEEVSQLDTLEALLNEQQTETVETEEETAGKAPEKASKAKPQSLKELAEKLELEDKDLYAIQVPFANGE